MHLVFVPLPIDLHLEIFSLLGPWEFNVLRAGSSIVILLLALDRIGFRYVVLMAFHDNKYSSGIQIRQFGSELFSIREFLAMTDHLE